MNAYKRCQCRHGDHDLDGKPDRCLNDAGFGRRLCPDCRKSSPWTKRYQDWTEAELREAWGR